MEGLLTAFCTTSFEKALTKRRDGDDKLRKMEKNGRKLKKMNAYLLEIESLYSKKQLFRPKIRSKMDPQQINNTTKFK